MIIVTSTFTADVMRPSLEGLLKKFSHEKPLFIYNQLMQQAILPNSEFNKNERGVNVMLIRLSDLFDFHLTAKGTKQRLNELITALNTLQKSMHVPLLLLITPTFPVHTQEEKHFFTLEEKLQAQIVSFKNTLFLTSRDLIKQSQTDLIFDPFTEKHGHMPYTFEFYTTLSYLLVRNYSLLTRKPYKVIVLDCDGTLWRGIVEEDGVEGLTIDDSFIQFQQFIIACYQAGFLICLCSKNSEASVLAVFKTHKNMPLNLKKHICTHRINWELKSVNIKSIAKELNLGLDSFIFIDDNKIECAEVKASIPEVLVIELPLVIKKRLPYLKNIWAFDSLNKEDEDSQRTKFYQTNRLRNHLKSQSLSYADFLKNLQIKIITQDALMDDYERIYQLSLRTNQFNLVPQALTGIKLNQYFTSRHSHCLTVRVIDKFGDYGLVGAIIYEATPPELVIHHFFLSCRILGRGIEYQIIKNLSEIAEKNKCTHIKILFKVTERNIPAMTFIKQLSGLSDLDKATFIILKVGETKGNVINDSEPTLSQPTHSIAQPIKKVMSNDFMLEIARDVIKKPANAKKLPINTLSLLQVNLKALFQRYHMPINHPESSLIELGLDSLRSVLITSAINQIYQIEMAPFELLAPNLSLNQLVHKIIDSLCKHKKATQDLIFNSSIKIPLSNAQQRLWYDEKLSPLSPKNTMFIAYEVKEIDSEILYRAFMTLIERHEALRFSFHEENNEPYITLNDVSHVNFQLIKRTNPSVSKLNQLIETFKQTSFDLSQLPLFNLALINLDKGKQIFLMSIHHIIHDGWSLHLLLDELNLIYNANIKGVTPIFLKPASYVNYIYWQKEVISNALLLKQKNFWKKQVRGLQKLELVYDKPRVDNSQKPPAKRFNFKIDQATTRQLKHLAAANQATLYDVLVTAFSVFLAHYTYQKDISFLTAVSGRHHPQAGRVIGFFINLIVLRFSVNHRLPFLDLLKNNKKISAKIFAHQDFPYHEILQLTGETVSSKVNSFNQAGFIFQNYPIPQLQLNEHASKRLYADDKAELIYDACQVCRFGNLVFFMQTLGANLEGMIEYNASLYHEKTIALMASSFTTLLKNIVKQSQIPAMSIPLITDKQKEKVFHQWNSPIISYPSHINLLTQFSTQVLKYSSKIAVKSPNESITYAELDKKSTQLAYQLKQEGVTQETPVGILLEQSIGQIIAMLGILKAGGCYVPLERDLPAARIKYMVEDSALRYLIAEKDLVSFIRDTLHLSIKVIVLTYATYLEQTTPLAYPATPRQLAYILYTSGSTGLPKGVAIEQQSILRLVLSPNYITFKSSDFIAQTSNFLFDAATFEIWGALLNGATLVLIDKPTLLDATALSSRLAHEKISILFLTTQLFHTYCFTSPELFRQLNYLIIGGEAVLADAVSNLFNQQNSPHYFINGYGPTENTTFSTAFTLKNKTTIPNPIPIGRPILGTTAYILGANSNPMPIGAPGKLYLGGLGLMRHYLNKTSLNQKKFIYPFKKRLYDTGDIAVWQSDGYIKYLGREDDQVKINGYRIELKEIEAQLKMHPLVEQAIVLVKTNEHHRQLAAYIVLKDHHKLATVNMHHHLKTTLPHYMLPTLYYQIEQVPLTNNGKVDKKLLSHLFIEPTNYSHFELPTTLLEEKIILLFKKTLGLKAQPLSINSDFFELGGNSISALTLIHLINKAFNITINFSILYAHSTIKLLSQALNPLINSVSFTLPLNKACLDEFSLKTIKVGAKDKTPIIFVHPIGGTGFCYLDLIKLLPADLPCYILQDPSIEANQILFDDLPSMATYYNQLLLNKFKDTQLILAGYSFGGMLSLEMVAQLEPLNLAHRIDYIISFDTWVVSNLLNLHAKETLKASIMQQYERVAKNLRDENIDPKPWMELYYRRLQELGFAYTPPQINKKIILFKAKNQTKEFQVMNDPTNYLKLYNLGPVEVHFVPGNHDSLLQSPNVEYISNTLNRYIRGPVYEDA